MKKQSNGKPMKAILKGNEIVVLLEISDETWFTYLVHEMAKRTVCEWVEDEFFALNRLTEPLYVYQEEEDKYYVLVTPKTGKRLNEEGFQLSFQMSHEHKT